MATLKIGCLNKQSALAIALSTISIAVTQIGVVQRLEGPYLHLCLCCTVDQMVRDPGTNPEWPPDDLHYR